MPARPGRRRSAAGGGAAHPRQLRHLAPPRPPAGDGRHHPPRQRPARRGHDHGRGQRRHPHHPRGRGRGRQAAAAERHGVCGQPAHRRLPPHLRPRHRLRRKDRAGWHRQRRAGARQIDGTGGGGLFKRPRSALRLSGRGLRRAGRDGGIPPLRGPAGRTPLRHRARGGQRGGHRRRRARDGIQVGRAGQEVRERHPRRADRGKDERVRLPAGR